MTINMVLCFFRLLYITLVPSLRTSLMSWWRGWDPKAMLENIILLYKNFKKEFYQN